jgi:hypothetical protein
MVVDFSLINTVKACWRLPKTVLNVGATEHQWGRKPAGKR